MPFELITRDRAYAGPSGRESLLITQYANGQWAMSDAAYRLLGEPDAILLLYDPDTQRIAIQASRRTHPNAYCLTKRKGQQGAVWKCPALNRRAGIVADATHRYVVTVEGASLVFTVGEYARVYYATTVHH